MNSWLVGARPRTLPAAVVPVAIGAGCAVGAGSVTWWRVAVALVVSLALQVGVNYANDYSDGVRGTDDARVGPVRLVASGLQPPGAVKRAAFAAFVVAAVAGLALAAATSWWLLAVGAAAIAAAWFYTGGPRPYGYAGLGEVFVFVFFGLVATVGTTYVAVERITGASVILGCAAGCLACSMLVVNNLRDIPGDTGAGKRTLAVRLGDARTRLLYLALLVAAALAVIAAAPWRPAVLLALLAAPLALPAVTAVRQGARGPALIPVLGATGRFQLVFGALATVGLVLSS
jgi:1,4-dihydroxy-2-naphthoate octaprenyltransferase